MTFTEIRQEILDRLGYTSTSASTRVGRLINKVYRETGTSIGMSFARQTNTSEITTIGNAAVTFSETEKILQVWRLDGSSNPVILSEVLLLEMREAVIPTSDKPTAWALVSTTSNGCTIRLNAKPSTAYTLYADVIAEVADLSGTNEPTFPESFHDILIEGVLKDEYRKLEKVQLARDSEATFQRRMSDLRMFVAKSAYQDIQQGKIGSTASSRAGGGTASQAVTGATSSTDNAVARWNGTGGTSIQNSGVTISDTDDVLVPTAGTLTLPNAGLHLFDTDASHDLVIKPGSNLTADRILTVTTADAARTLTISGDATVSQDYSTAGSPQFTGLTVTGDGTVTGTLTFDADGLHIFDTNATHDLIITPGSNLTADRVLTLTTGDAARTLTISADVTLDQNVATTSDVNFNTVGINDSDDSHQLVLLTTSNLTADRNLTLVSGDASRTVTISGDATISQDYSTAGSPTLTGVTTTGTTALATGSGATVTLGGGATASELRLLEPSGSGVNYTALKAQAQAANITYTLPPDDGDSGEFLKTDGSGSLTWEVPSGLAAGSDTHVQFNDGGTLLGGDAGLTYNKTTDVLTAGSLIATLGHIAFPATYNASSDANTLDDYEEGVWTPVIGGSGGTSGQVYSVQLGLYVKIGQLVMCSFRVVLSTEGTITGNAQIQGLPFTSHATATFAAASIQWFALATTWVFVSAEIPNSVTVATLRGTTVAATESRVVLSAADIGNTTELNGTIVYRAA